MKRERLDSTRDLESITSASKQKSGGASAPPEYSLPRPSVLSIVGPAVPLASGLFLCRRLCWPGFFSTLGADQRQVVFCVKRVPANGLLSGGTQGDVYAPIVGQDQHS